MSKAANLLGPELTKEDNDMSQLDRVWSPLEHQITTASCDVSDMEGMYGSSLDQRRSGDGTSIGTRDQWRPPDGSEAQHGIITNKGNTEAIFKQPQSYMPEDVSSEQFVYQTPQKPAIHGSDRAQSEVESSDHFATSIDATGNPQNGEQYVPSVLELKPAAAYQNPQDDGVLMVLPVQPVGHLQHQIMTTERIPQPFFKYAMGSDQVSHSEGSDSEKPTTVDVVIPHQATPDSHIATRDATAQSYYNRMVTGLENTRLTDGTHVGRCMVSLSRSISVIQEPHHILQDVSTALGEALHPMVVHVDRLPNGVQFYIKTSVYRVPSCQPDTRVTQHEESRASHIANLEQFPEAYDCHKILKHIRRRPNLHEYSDLLGYRKPADLKRDIDQFYSRIPSRVSSRSPHPTWDSLFDTLDRILSFLRKAVEGLEGNSERSLAAKIVEGRVEIEEIRTRAREAQIAQESNRTGR